MDKEQLKKILEPIKQICSSYEYCDECPLYNKDHHCSLKRHLLGDINDNLINNTGKPYIEILEKCIHEFCGRDSCRYCPRICTLNRFPAKWNLDELP